MPLCSAEKAAPSARDTTSAELQAQPRPPWAENLADIFRQTNIALFTFPKPIVGALEKCAINAGAALALSCDILIAGRDVVPAGRRDSTGRGHHEQRCLASPARRRSGSTRITLYGDRVSAPETTGSGWRPKSYPTAMLSPGHAPSRNDSQASRPEQGLGTSPTCAHSPASPIPNSGSASNPAQCCSARRASAEERRRPWTTPKPRR